MTEHPGEQFPPAVDPDVEPQPDERRTPDYDTEPEPDITPYVDQADAVDYTEAPLETEDTEQTFEASLEDNQAFGEDEVGEAEQDAPVASAGPFVPKPGPPASFQPRPGPPTGFTPKPAPPAAEQPKPGLPGGFSPTPAPPQPATQVQPAAEEEQGEYREDGVHPLVEETMERLDGLRERPVAEHAEVYADLHERLQTALVEADAEHGDRG